MNLEYRGDGLDPEVLRYLECVRRELDIDPGAMKVLDFGCKDGRCVAELCSVGYDVYGVDISDQAVARGRAILGAEGGDANRLLVWEDVTGALPFPDRFFDFVYSNAVFEHVENAERVVSEIARVTRRSGYGFHIFPAPLRPIECHLFMPFVHWLPKNVVRRAAIYVWVALGREPWWRELQGKSVGYRADTYFRYSCEKTFYRSFVVWRRQFARHGMQSADVSVRHPRLQHHSRLGWLARWPMTRPFVALVVGMFKRIECLTYRP